MKKIFSLICAGLIFVASACSCNKVKVPSASDGSFDMNSQTFGVDKNVNIENKIKICASNSFAFGGANACLVIGL